MPAESAAKHELKIGIARCPRCGYDQRGVIASWDDACPMQGICAECGLEFEWAELLSSKLIPPRWCVEYGRWWSVPHRGLTTMVVALWPPRFFSLLKMTHRPRWGRLMAFLLLSFGLVLIMTALSHGYYGWSIWREHDRSIADYNARIPQWNARSQQVPAGAGGVLLTPVTNAYSPLEVVARFLFLPLSDQRPAPNLPAANANFTNIRGPLRWNRLPSPREVFRTRYRFPRRPVPFLATMAFPLLVQLLMPIGFVATPWSRRKARVRWSHVVRITTYGCLSMWIPILTVMFMLPREQAGWPLAYERMLERLGLVSFLLVPLLMVTWWRCAIRDHLKMPHAWGLSGSMLAMGVLLLMLCGYFNFIINQWPGGYLFITGQG